MDFCYYVVIKIDDDDDLVYEKYEVGEIYVYMSCVLCDLSDVSDVLDSSNKRINSSN